MGPETPLFYAGKSAIEVMDDATRAVRDSALVADAHHTTTPMKRLLIVLAILSLSAALLLAACSGPDDDARTRDQTLVRANIAEPSTLDPHRAEGVSAGNV